MSSKSDVVVKLILVFFISLLSFSIGTFVGKKYSDNQYKLSALEPKKVAKEERSVASVDDKNKKSETLTDDEIKKLAEEFVADDSEDSNHSTAESHNSHSAEKKPAPSQATAAADSHDEKPEHKPAPSENKPAKAAVTQHDSATAAAHDIIDGKTTAATATARPRRPTSLPKDVAQYSVGKYTVQVASFATEQEARQRANELKEKGYSAFFVPAQVKGKSWYRVSVGLFANENEAKEYKKEFMAKSKVESAIIQKIAN